jgi:hypothetical protein
MRARSGAVIQITEIPAPPFKEQMRAAGGDAQSAQADRLGAGADEIVFPEAVRNLPISSADPYLNEMLIEYCRACFVPPEGEARRQSHCCHTEKHTQAKFLASLV